MYKRTLEEVQKTIDQSEFSTLSYNKHCSYEFEDHDIIVTSDELNRSPKVIGYYKEGNKDNNRFWYEVKIQLPYSVVGDDGFGEFGYLSRAVKALVDLANYLNKHTFYFTEED